MFRIDTSDAAVTKPTRAAAGPKPDGHFTSTATDGTTVTDDWAEAIQEELTHIVETVGDTLDKTDDAQVYDALVKMLKGTSTDIVNPFMNYALFVDEKPQNTVAQTLSINGWNVRDLNTTRINDISGVSIAANQITLPAGEYRVSAVAGQHRFEQTTSGILGIYDTTGSSTLARGINSYQDAGSNSGGDDRVLLEGGFTLGVQSVVELRHDCNQTGAVGGFQLNRTGLTEVYAELQIWKLD
jgi:hypothetical protein